MTTIIIINYQLSFITPPHLPLVLQQVPQQQRVGGGGVGTRDRVEVHAVDQLRKGMGWREWMN